MSAGDTKLRELERAWRASGCWPDWLIWAQEALRQGDPLPWEFQRAWRRVYCRDRRVRAMREANPGYYSDADRCTISSPRRRRVLYAIEEARTRAVFVARRLGRKLCRRAQLPPPSPGLPPWIEDAVCDTLTGTSDRDRERRELQAARQDRQDQARLRRMGFQTGFQTGHDDVDGILNALELEDVQNEIQEVMSRIGDTLFSPNRIRDELDGACPYEWCARQMQALRGFGWSSRRIADLFACSQITVRRYLSGAYSEKAPDPMDQEPAERRARRGRRGRSRKPTT